MPSAIPAGGFLCFMLSAFCLHLHLPFFLYGLTGERGTAEERSDAFSLPGRKFSLFFAFCLSAALAAFLPRVNGGLQRKDPMPSAIPDGGFLCFCLLLHLHLPLFFHGRRVSGSSPRDQSLISNVLRRICRSTLVASDQRLSDKSERAEKGERLCRLLLRSRSRVVVRFFLLSYAHLSAPDDVVAWREIQVPGRNVLAKKLAVHCIDVCLGRLLLSSRGRHVDSCRQVLECVVCH